MNPLTSPAARFFSTLVLATLAVAAAPATQPGSGDLDTITAPPVPPPMPRRAIAPTTASALPGRTLDIDNAGDHFTLFLPSAWHPDPSSHETRLVVHFHGAVWFAIQEHLRHGLDVPLLVFYPGEGSSLYQRNFKDPERFGTILAQVEDVLGKQGLPNGRITSVDLSTFSAGYGAVREILKEQKYRRIVRRVVLADSMYAAWDPATTRPGATSRPSGANMDPWLPFARLAAEGKKEFVLTHSQVPTSYANSAACAAALIEAVGARKIDVPRGALPATLDADFPLLYRADLGGFHVWGYGGQGPDAHMTHARHIADVWRALDAADHRASASAEGR